MIYSIPYILYFIFLLVLSVITYQRKEDNVLCMKLKVVGVISFVLFFGFRGFIWHDWTIYYEMFEECSWSDLLEYDYFKSREPGWLLFELLCKSIGGSYQFLVFCSTIINTLLLLRFLRRYTENILFGLAIYLVFNGFVLSINLMRNAIAIFLFLNALVLIEQKKPFQYTIICLLAATFHLSALVFLPLYMVLNVKLNKWVFLCLVVFANLLLFSGFSIFYEIASRLFEDNEIIAYKLSAYEDYGKHAGSRFILLQQMVTCVLVFCYYETLTAKRSGNTIFINSLLCYMLGTALTSEFSEVSVRVGIIFVYPYWILWYDLLKSFYYQGNRWLFGSFAMFYALFYLVISINTPVNEYQNYLLGNTRTYQQSLDNFNKTFKEPD